MPGNVSRDDMGDGLLLTNLSLLKILQDGRFHSGEQIGSELGISRSAVWKRIKKINSQFGVIVHSVSGRGYRLTQEMKALTPQERFKGRHFAWDLALFGSLDSTNAEALRRLEAGAVTPLAVVAEQQTAGRGRRGRVWVSPFGENLYFSLLLKIDRGVKGLEGLSLVVGLAVVAALRKVGVQDIGLKWPNDVLASGRKIAGVLLELAGDLADVCHVVIGIGINANMLVSGEKIDQEWTSASIETGLLIDRNRLLLELQIQLDEYLAAHALRGFSAFINEWDGNDLWRERLVELSSGGSKVSGMVKGVDATGALLLSVGGVVRAFSGGELSLRLKHDT
jgi:BirA family biotin operon repressor/biotin-[acetyl-CoA-carboxylase] ligase